MTLTEFLTARLDEDAKEARYRADRRLARVRPIGDTVANLTIRALREVEAKRAIINRFARKQARRDEFPTLTQDDATALAVLRLTVMDLAAVYADHPDYREEWRP